MLPATSLGSFSAEVWVCAEGVNGSSRIALSSGHFELGLDKNGSWTFTVFHLAEGFPVTGRNGST